MSLLPKSLDGPSLAWGIRQEGVPAVTGSSLTFRSLPYPDEDRLWGLVRFLLGFS